MKSYGLLFFIFPFFIASAAHAAILLHVSQANIIQGEPVMITVSGTTSLPAATSPRLYFFMYRGVPTALYGADLHQATGTVSVSVIWKDGTTATTSFLVRERVSPTEFIPVPASLGGNSSANQTRVVSELEKDNTDLLKTYSRKDKALWTAIFSFPVANPVVTDPYGFVRSSGDYVIAHKGTDFHAPPGTPVDAVNRGVVRVAKYYPTYGNTIVVDHGLGVLSIYMHLSKIFVGAGELVLKGEKIGLSGETGYAEGPHLHLSIRIGNISVDPMKFFALFGVTLPQ
ncbi:MAG: M23 family metallopeptidase [Patescibacteria group bacterium]|nr:M23 family metallopeptidase [Patescibacteria group bacterium]MDE1945965.1 M23 family metallopeptidase [Patescibacteria group bacterium]